VSPPDKRSCGVEHHFADGGVQPPEGRPAQRQGAIRPSTSSASPGAGGRGGSQRHPKACLKPLSRTSKHQQAGPLGSQARLTARPAAAAASGPVARHAVACSKPFFESRSLGGGPSTSAAFSMPPPAVGPGLAAPLQHVRKTLARLARSPPAGPPTVSRLQDHRRGRSPGPALLPCSQPNGFVPAREPSSRPPAPWTTPAARRRGGAGRSAIRFQSRIQAGHTHHLGPRSTMAVLRPVDPAD